MYSIKKINYKTVSTCRRMLQIPLIEDAASLTIGKISR